MRSLRDVVLPLSRPTIAAWCLSLVLPMAVAQAPAAMLTLHYQERPPYSYAGPGGVVAGLVAGPAERALGAAGIGFVWALTPSQRQLALIQGGTGLHCGVGWFRTAERARLGKFSRPLYRDQPFAALARVGAPFPAALRAAEAFAAGPVTLLVKEGYSYGAVLDALIAQAPAAALQTSADVTQMARMLLAGRADWMIVAPEEAQVLLGSAETASSGLKMVRFTDLPAGEARHLYCNAAVPDEWMVRIDRALPR